MLNKVLPEKFFNMLPLPILVVKHMENTLNHPIVFANEKFTEELGWTAEEIPDKQSWWEKAYPDKNYQKVVERQWELEMLSAVENNEGFVFLDVNITTKQGLEKRYKVYTEINSQLVPGYYVVAFEFIPDTFI
jgi:hypothetical protein